MPTGAELQRLEAWIDQYQPKVYKAACLVLRDPAAAEDVAQETFLRAWNAMERVDEDVNIERWLCRISINLCLNQLRSRRRERTALDRVASSQSLNQSFEIPSTKSEIDEALRKLPDRLRVPIILRYYLDFAEAEIAKSLSIRAGTVKSRLHEARRLLANDASIEAAHSGG